MVAREFRGHSVSTEETFSSTTVLMMVKVLMVISLVKGLLMSALDVSDVFFSSHATWRCCCISTQLGEGGSWRSQPDVLAVAEMFARATQCCDALERAPHRPSWWTQFRAHAGYSFQRSWKGYFPSGTHRGPVADFQWGGHKGNFRETVKTINWLWRFMVLTVSVNQASCFNWTDMLRLKKMGFSLHRMASTSRSWQNFLRSERRGKTVPHHNALNVLDAEIIPTAEYFWWTRTQGSSAQPWEFGCALPRRDWIPNRLSEFFSNYMGRPNKIVLCALRTLGCYLIDRDSGHADALPESKNLSQQLWDDRMELKSDVMENSMNWNLYSDSNWANCKFTRRSGNFGLIFLNGCRVHSHSRAQASFSLSSVETKIRAATIFFDWSTLVKQFRQFLKVD